MEEQRPTPIVEDIETTRQRLADWFSQRRGYDVRISDMTVPEATGMSNITLLFDIEFEQDGNLHTEACVGRLQPDGGEPIFPSYDLEWQYRVMAALGEHSDVPVPTMLGLETNSSVLGVPFYVMKKSEGRIPTDMPPYNMDGWMMHDIGPAQRTALWNAGLDTLAHFHKVDYRTLGLDDRLSTQESQPLQHQLDYWREYHDWALAGQRSEICSQALDWLQANQPADEPAALCWGDARISNLIFTEDCAAVEAVLDWEMATLGNPVQDLAWYCQLDRCFSEGLGIERLEGLPSYEDTVARWESITGYSSESYDYYCVFATMRFGLLIARVMHATGQPAEEAKNNFAVQILVKALESVGQTVP